MPAQLHGVQVRHANKAHCCSGVSDGAHGGVPGTPHTAGLADAAPMPMLPPMPIEAATAPTIRIRPNMSTAFFHSCCGVRHSTPGATPKLVAPRERGYEADRIHLSYPAFDLEGGSPPAQDHLRHQSARERGKRNQAFPYISLSGTRSCASARRGAKSFRRVPRRAARSEVALHRRPRVDPNAQHALITPQPQLRQRDRLVGIWVVVARIGHGSRVQSKAIFRALRHPHSMQPSEPERRIPRRRVAVGDMQFICLRIEKARNVPRSTAPGPRPSRPCAWPSRWPLLNYRLRAQSPNAATLFRSRTITFTSIYGRRRGVTRPPGAPRDGHCLANRRGRHRRFLRAVDNLHDRNPRGARVFTMTLPSRPRPRPSKRLRPNAPPELCRRGRVTQRSNHLVSREGSHPSAHERS